MDLEIIILSEVIQEEKEIPYDIAYISTYLQNRNRLTDIENRPVVAKEECGKEELDWEVEIIRCELLYIE